MEGMIDRLADRVGISAWEMRRRNVVTPGVVWGPGQIMHDGCRCAEMCLDAVKAHFDAAVADGKAVGLGLGMKNSGLGNGFLEIAGAVIRFEEDGTVEVRHCWTKMGQGVHDVALQVAAEELGVDPNRIRVVVDTTANSAPARPPAPRARSWRPGPWRTPAARPTGTPGRSGSTTRGSTASTGRTSSKTMSTIRSSIRPSGMPLRCSALGTLQCRIVRPASLLGVE
jgi:CO/xanthine dehydrogenase Mo-binding subunit